LLFKFQFGSLLFTPAFQNHGRPLSQNQEYA
jgi:hypothetical protein